MRIEMKKAAEPGLLRPSANWDVAVVGEVLDDRGSVAVAFVSSAKTRIRLSYDPDELSLYVNDHPINTDALEALFVSHRGSRIILESTTLGFAEVFLCCRALRRLGFREVSILYVEPGEYRRPRSPQLLHKRHFELSGRVPGYRAIPGAALMFDDRIAQETVFFLGYEDHRLDTALEQFPINPAHATAVFGVPAFQAGWEMDSFANNIGVLRQQKPPMAVRFCGAENPYAAYQILAAIHERCNAERKQLFVGPIGTKPHGIGTALFVAEHDGVGLLYDHPIRTPKRTSSVLNWHLFEATF